jgi:branched-chain amino acid transport system ATP-binding protein
VLCYGRILAAGTPDAIRQNPAVVEAYLGTELNAGAAI